MERVESVEPRPAELDAGLLVTSDTIRVLLDQELRRLGWYVCPESRRHLLTELVEPIATGQ